VFNNILIVCIGNICRSPMAEALLKLRAPDGVHVHSAGIGALVDKPADPIAVQLMQMRGIDITAHRARQLVPEMVDQAELILVMEAAHQRYIRAVSPSACGKIQLLGKWVEQEIPDPYKQAPKIFASTLEVIEKGVDMWAEKLWPGCAS